MFDIRESIALPGYLNVLCSWPTLWSRVRAGQTGMGGRRRRVHPDRLLEVRVPLPTIGQQRRIVDLIAAVVKAIEASGAFKREAEQAKRSLLRELLGSKDRSEDCFEEPISSLLVSFASLMGPPFRQCDGATLGGLCSVGDVMMSGGCGGVKLGLDAGPGG
jgi:hypothetical protein